MSVYTALMVVVPLPYGSTLYMSHVCLHSLDGGSSIALWQYFIHVTAHLINSGYLPVSPYKTLFDECNGTPRNLFIAEVLSICPTFSKPHTSAT